ncbi:hypothetical protein AB0C84_44920 [Actinomadura sp. NPDC048955]|uniref:hypothetical protein n=1 Tax=Actinomadura sp. NPDC048955 TaxID=3158228 RepID=UPI0033F7F2A2
MDDKHVCKFTTGVPGTETYALDGPYEITKKQYKCTCGATATLESSRKRRVGF